MMMLLLLLAAAAAAVAVAEGVVMMIRMAETRTTMTTNDDHDMDFVASCSLSPPQQLSELIQMGILTPNTAKAEVTPAGTSQLPSGLTKHDKQNSITAAIQSLRTCSYVFRHCSVTCCMTATLNFFLCSSLALSTASRPVLPSHNRHVEESTISAPVSLTI